MRWSLKTLFGRGGSQVLTGLAIAGWLLLAVLYISLYVSPVQKWLQAVLVG